MKRKILLPVLIGFVLLVLLSGGGVYYLIFAPQFNPSQTVHVYIDRDDTMDSVCYKMEEVACPGTLVGFYGLSKLKGYAQRVRTGRYAIGKGDNVFKVFKDMYRGHQEPVNLTIGSVRALDRLARSIGGQLMIDSAEIARQWSDSLFLQKIGYNAQTIIALFIPDTYQVYWDMSVEAFFLRMQKEYSRFWTDRRLEQAKAIGMTPMEVCTLASIVDEETNKDDEKAMVAGVYINRLQRNMPLQADPTIKFALQNFEIKRISNNDLQVDSPYNTYLYVGLPPGPIRVASRKGVESVLNYVRHNYIYMCAKEDFSGRHNFASTYAEHMANARKYWKKLNERKIFR